MDIFNNLVGAEWATAWTLRLLLWWAFGLLGIYLHFVNRRAKGAQIKSFRDYFLTDINYTIYTLVGYIVLYLLVAKAMQMNVVLAFGCGWMADTWINKYTPPKVLGGGS